MNDKAFAQLTFSQEVKDQMGELTHELVPEEHRYYSPVVDHIRGIMTNTLHFTLFFGLEPDAVENKELKEYLNSVKLSELKLGDLFFINGYKNLYRVFGIKVVDEENELFNIANEISKFAKNQRYLEREYKPHLTLAYVTNDYMLPGDLPEIPELLPVKDIKVTLMSEFNQEANRY